jgi:hypothetical protein
MNSIGVVAVNEHTPAVAPHKNNRIFCYIDPSAL